MTEQQEARNLFRAAYENRYTWDQSFPGYTADVTLQQGDQVYKGRVRINPNLTADVLDIEDEQAKKSIADQAWEIAIHRVRRAFEDTHGKNSFSFGETDETGAVEILVNGQASGDRYKVRNNEVTLVHRRIHNVVVTINTFSTHKTEAGYLSHRYDSIYHDPKTGEQKSGISDFEDNYEKIDGYYILTQRIIQGMDGDQEVSTEFNFSNIKLLQPATVG